MSSLKSNSRVQPTQQASAEKLEKEPSTSIFSKYGKKKSEDVNSEKQNKRVSLAPKKKDRKKVHVQPHFNMKLIEEVVVKTSDNSLETDHEKVEPNTKKSDEPDPKVVQSAVDVSVVESREVLPHTQISRAKTILKSKTDNDIVTIIDELNNLAQSNISEDRRGSNKNYDSEFADVFFKKLNYLTDSLVQPRLDAIKFVSGNLKEESDISQTFTDSRDNVENVTVSQLDALFEKENGHENDKETMTDVVATEHSYREMEAQTEPTAEFVKIEIKDEECQTDTLLVMSNALVGQLWKLNEALTTKMKEYDEAMQKQSDTIDELRERNKTLWNEIRTVKMKGSASELPIQTLNRRDLNYTATLARRDGNQ